MKKFSEATTNGPDAWKKAKKQNSFKVFLPHLSKIIALSQKKAEMLRYKDHPYDALLDHFEPGVTVQKLDEIFAPLKTRLVALVNKITSQGSEVDETWLNGHFPIDRQKKLSHEIITNMGLPRDCYDLSETAHPFCLPLSPRDIRLTTHFYEDNLIKGLSSTIHECGHALYELHLPLEEFGTPLCEAASFGIHESQSRIWETFIGQSFAFQQHYFPKIKSLFPDSFQNVTLEQFYKALNHVKPSFIRIYADEVTYNLHIILRYEIEKGLLDGSIAVENLPEVWNEKMQTYLGITPRNHAEGCLQDIHWAAGLIGYFPSYTLGNLFAGSLNHALTKAHPDSHNRIANGDLAFITHYLRDNVHKFGRQYLPLELIERATNAPFSPEHYLSYLETKYLT